MKSRYAGKLDGRQRAANTARMVQPNHAARQVPRQVKRAVCNDYPLGTVFVGGHFLGGGRLEVVWNWEIPKNKLDRIQVGKQEFRLYHRLMTADDVLRDPWTGTVQLRDGMGCGFKVLLDRLRLPSKAAPL